MADWSAPSAEPCFSFGPFRFFPARQLLLEGETLVRLGSRALEILAALVERPGELVSKDELTARVWPNTVVEESNLKVNVCALRRALGEGQPGRRYVAIVSWRRSNAPNREHCRYLKAPLRSACTICRPHRPEQSGVLTQSARS